MPEFLKLVSPQSAAERFKQHLPVFQPQSELIPTAEAVGRVTAEAVRAGEPSPAFSRSTVDGYAVRAADVYGASDGLPAYLELAGEVPMGGAPAFAIKAGQAAVIYTGGMLPEGADAVVMLEYSQETRANEVELFRPVAVGENVVKRGEDVAENQVVVPAGQRLRPAEIGGLMALGITHVRVNRQPRLGILSSGDEVVPPDQPALPGQVRDCNTYSLAALVRQEGGLPATYPIIPDRVEAMSAAVARALAENDGVIITAGSSASTRDLTAEVIQAQGQPGVLVHGISIKPGKPTILAVVNGKPVIGLPGNPVSTLVIAELFVRPMVAYLAGVKQKNWTPEVSAELTVNVPSQAGREDWIPVRLIEAGSGWKAEPVFFKSSLIFNLAQADGMVKCDLDATGLEAGQQVSVRLLN
ncbi:MAG TPA: molybdopterin-binding protein [Anaerolineaceae bacterium]|nr:molybdopterin-binding protein [Anaerolineaceae bacterium]HPN50607.1 molybdopterin-binding protein [Anaerolineaceae bacterium]